MSEINKINLNLFKIVQISENNIDLSIYTCKLCNKNSSTISIFVPCNHSCCILCLDNLYDSYLLSKESSGSSSDASFSEEKEELSNDDNNNSVMFKCIFCHSKVYDITYKK